MKTKLYTYDCIVIGSGAAGYNAINRLTSDGSKNVALITEGIMLGTSRNTGSDKQTYYKLGLSGDSPDSVIDMTHSSSQHQGHQYSLHADNTSLSAYPSGSPLGYFPRYAEL